jgi:hypothetical protein
MWDYSTRPEVLRGLDDGRATAYVGISDTPAWVVRGRRYRQLRGWSSFVAYQGPTTSSTGASRPTLPSCALGLSLAFDLLGGGR